MADKRITEWDITIHKNDLSKEGKTLFDLTYLEKYLKEAFKSSSEVYFIKHDKDIEEDGSPKEEHIHLAIKTLFNQGKTFNRMKTLFPMSHLEEALNFDNAVLYLTHETSNAIEEGKFKYDRSEVINVFQSDVSKYYNKPQYEVFDFDKIEEYINDRGLRSILDYGRTFGYNVISSKWGVIKQIIEALYIEAERASKIAIHTSDSEVVKEAKELKQKGEYGYGNKNHD